MAIIDAIAYLFYLSYVMFYYIAADCLSIAFVGSWLNNKFLTVANYFYSLSANTYQFSVTMDYVIGELGKILSWSTIKSYILGWFYYLGDLTTIFYYFWTNVTSVITNWWNAAKLTVQGWIDTAKQFLQAQINSANTWLTNLQAAWNEWQLKIPSFNEIWSWFTNWWGNTLAKIITWGALTDKQIDSLIASWFKAMEPVWAGWQDYKPLVTSFFWDPIAWIKAHVFDSICDDFNKGFDKGLKGE